MAELLIYASNNLSGDTETDKGRYRKGDIVVVKDDGWQWGRMESKAVWIAEGRVASEWPKTFVLLKITGATVAQVLSLIDPDMTGEVMNARRLRFIDVDATPAQIKDKIGSDYEATVTKAAIKNYIKRKSDDAVYDVGFE
jgi:hypothetical protein